MTESFPSTLLQFARGGLSVDEAQAALGQRADFSFGTNPAWIEWREPLAADLSVSLTIDDVRNALNRFLTGEWMPRDLHLWAQFIALVGAYSFPDPPIDDEDYYDTAWDVIHDLSAPEIHGLATQESVRIQLAKLDGYGAPQLP
jgi:hypothetical protein